MRRALAFVGAVFVLATPAFARAADVDACVESADTGQELRDSGRLLEAREKLVVCSAATCPSAVAKQCAKWLQDVEQSLPTIVVRVRDAAGKDVSDATVSVDGALRAPAVDGRPIALDPGPHTILVRRSQSADTEEKIVVAAGEKNRVVTLESRPATAPPPKDPPKPPPPPKEPPPSKSGFTFPWYSGVFLGVGVAAFAGTAILVPLARGQANDLRSTCAPRCAQDDVDAVQAKITAANVLLGVGIGGIVLGVGSLVIANLVGKQEKVVAFAVPVSGGGVIGAVGRF